MIQFPESIADAYVLPARNIMLPTTPGRTVRFMSGHAVVKDGRDLVSLMRRPDVKIVLTQYATSWIETWLEAARGNIRAEVLMPSPEPPADAAVRA